MKESDSESKAPEPRCLETPWQFASHTAESMAIFLIVAVPAVVLDFLVRGLQNYGTSSLVVVCLKTAEYAYLGADLLAFLWRTIGRTMRKLWFSSSTYISTPINNFQTPKNVFAPSSAITELAGTAAPAPRQPPPDRRETNHGPHRDR